MEAIAPSGTAPRSLLQCLAEIAAQRVDAEALVFLPEGEPAGAISRTLPQLQISARRLAAVMRRQADAGARVLLLLPPGPDFFAAVWGSLLAGMVMVPAALPRLAPQVAFTKRILEDCGAELILTDAATLP